MKNSIFVLIALLIFYSCNQSQSAKNGNNNNQTQQLQDTSTSKLANEQKLKKPDTLVYQLEDTKQWLSMHETDSLALAIACAINRTDNAHLSRMDSIIIPIDLSYKLEKYYTQS